MFRRGRAEPVLQQLCQVCLTYALQKHLDQYCLMRGLTEARAYSSYRIIIVSALGCQKKIEAPSERIDILQPPLGHANII